MARRANTQPAAQAAAGEYVKLENRLTLLAWLNNLFGFRNNRDLLFDMKEAQEGFDSYGKSYVYHFLVGRGDKVRIPREMLGRYDENIKAHLDALNARRPEPVTLRYFQYLAILYTEIFLDWYFNRPGEMVHELNLFVSERNAAKDADDQQDSPFSHDDISKLAFWMATGSGKTLIMHFNLRQFLHYNKEALDNILLITPNEGLSDQHLAEMELSGVACARFNPEESGLRLGGKNVVRVIEITKLVEEKRGGGLSVDVESFEGNNLILVDEGHKGSGGEAWRRFRDRLGQTGFTFEYSATFGQALTAARNDTLTAEYGKAIAFDYSYKYFYGDGYGKDFHILNLREETVEDKTEVLLLGNLLSFYEQQHCYEEQSGPLRPYNIDKPLWVFVGSSVNAVFRESGKPRSDVLTIARFVHHFLENKRGWAVRGIEKLVEGRSGLVDADGVDVFTTRFKYLRGSRLNAERVYKKILSTVFHSVSGGVLHLCDIHSGSGELGLKASNSRDYFGVIYIGDTSSFKKLVEEDDSGIVLEEDAISSSLFGAINRPDTTIHMLIGAKKFMEGWNSWRVSNMGLLNIGRSEGSEIIQLFGRGVRLRGMHFSLKRSTALDGKHPEHIRLLETLNIFAVRANYMTQFRDYLEREGVDTGGHVELPLAIRSNKAFLGKGLVVPRVSQDRDFTREDTVILLPDKDARVVVDMSIKVEALRSATTGIETAAMRSGMEQVIPAESLDLIDWERIYLALLEYKEQKSFTNLIVRPDAARNIISAEGPRLYRLFSDDDVVYPRSYDHLAILQDAVLTILRRYMEKYYYVCKQRWESMHMEYRVLSKEDPNFRDYTIRIPRSEKHLIEAVQKLISDTDRIYREENNDLPNIHFDRHLYQPLLVAKGGKINSDPPGLKPSERRFVEDLRLYVGHDAIAPLASKEIFLLRNLSRGKGVGFFDSEGFFPDFILWIKEEGKLRIVFIEPHGMKMEKSYWADDKARLHERLRELAATWTNKAKKKDVVLDSFIISATPYDELREYYGDGQWSRESFAERHILFFDEGSKYISALFQ